MISRIPELEQQSRACIQRIDALLTAQSAGQMSVSVCLELDAARTERDAMFHEYCHLLDTQGGD